MNKPVSGLLLAILLLSSCTVGPSYKRPKMDLPPQWLNNIQFSQKAEDSLKAPVKWWLIFNDLILNQLMEDAYLSNLDLQQATLRVLKVQAQADSMLGGMFPQAEVAIDGSRQRNVFAMLPSTYNQYQPRINVSWEIDFFGGNQRRLEAALASVEAQAAARAAIVCALRAEVAQKYIDYRLAQQLIAIAEKNISAQTRTLTLTQQQMDAGRTTKFDVLRAEAQLEQTKARLPSFKIALQKAQSNLEMLLAKLPGELTHLLTSVKELPCAQTSLILKSPAETLRQRPDLIEAERHLALATALQGYAVSNLFPKISLEGMFGFLSTSTSNLFTHTNRSWQYGAGIHMPILSFGRLQAEIDQADDQKQIAFMEYKKILIKALNDMEQAIIQLNEDEQSYICLKKALIANQHTVSLAHKRFEAGVSSFLEVLDAEKNLFSIESEWVQTSGRQAYNVVTLYKAMGSTGEETWVSEKTEELLPGS